MRRSRSGPCTTTPTCSRTRSVSTRGGSPGRRRERGSRSGKTKRNIFQNFNLLNHFFPKQVCAKLISIFITVNIFYQKQIYGVRRRPQGLHWYEVRSKVKMTKNSRIPPKKTAIKYKNWACKLFSLLFFRFAMAEMKITLAKLLRAFRISATEETKLDCYFLNKYIYFEGN